MKKKSDTCPISTAVSSTGITEARVINLRKRSLLAQGDTGYFIAGNMLFALQQQKHKRGCVSLPDYQKETSVPIILSCLVLSYLLTLPSATNATSSSFTTRKNGT